MAIQRLSGGLTPANGADPRTFPTIWNAAAAEIEAQGTAITGAESDIDALEAKNLPSFGTATPVSGDSLVYDGTQWVNGPRSHNAIINGDFGIWQRGTSFTQSGAGNQYTSDRWNYVIGTGGTATITRESFTPADIEAVGYGDAEYFIRVNTTSVASMTANWLRQRVEDARTFANQTVTISFWAKSTSPYSLAVGAYQFFGSGGSSATTTFDVVSLTTSWTRHKVTLSIPSVSGKTFGTGSWFEVRFIFDTTATNTYDIWGVQLEAGPVATPFRLAGGGSKAAELALCQRYYYRVQTGANAAFGASFNLSTTQARGIVSFPVEMRISPLALEQSGIAGDYELLITGPLGIICTAVPVFHSATKVAASSTFTVGAGLTGGQGSQMRGRLSTNYLAWSAEL